MAEKTFELQFNGYWREPNIGGLPKKSGIYCVYSCTYDETRNTVSIQRLLYIGESKDVQGRVKGHPKKDEWKRQLRSGEVLCFNAADIEAASRERAEAALIYHHKPVCNVEYKDSFPFDKTTVTTSGLSARLSRTFTVYRTRS